MNMMTTPIPSFYEADGTPLENGYIYIGAANLDARTNQIQVYTDAALSVTIGQPIRTLGGYPVYQGAPVQLFVAATSYSMTTQTKEQVNVITNKTSDVFASGGSTGYTIETYAGIAATTIPAAVDSFYLQGYTAVGDGGAATYARVASEPAHPAKAQSEDGAWWEIIDTVRNVAMYGATGVGDETAQFVAALSYTGPLVINPLPASAEYTVSGTLPVYAQLVGQGGRARIHVTVTDTEMGFKIETGGALDMLRIRRTSVSPSGSGTHGNAITIAPPDFEVSSTDEFYDWRIGDIEIVADGAVSNVVSIINNAYRGQIDRLKISGDFLFPLLFHWGWLDRDGSPPETKCPRNINVGLIEVDGGGSANTRGVTISGCHDIRFGRIIHTDSATGFVVQPGDVGGEFAVDDSEDRVLSGIIVDQLISTNVIDDECRVNGYGYILPDTTNRRWNMTDHAYTGVTVKEFISVKGSASAGESVQFRQARNCHVGILRQSLLPGASVTSLSSGILITSSVDCSVNGSVLSSRAATIASGYGTKLNLIASNPDTATPANSVNGIRMDGAGVAHTVNGAVLAGATSLVIDAITTMIYPGLCAVYNDGSNDHIITFTSSWYYDPALPAGNLDAAPSIMPAPVAIPDAATLTILEGAHSTTISGSYEGYWAGVRISSTHALIPMNTEVMRARFERSGVYGYLATNGRGHAISDCTFDQNNSTDTATGANVRIEGSSTAISISRNRYNEKGNAIVAFNNWFEDTVRGVVNGGNIHYPFDETHASHAADFYENAAIAPIYALNWYDPLITNDVVI